MDDGGPEGADCFRFVGNTEVIVEPRLHAVVISAVKASNSEVDICFGSGAGR